MRRCSELSGGSSSGQPAEWPPVWKAAEDSPQFECGMLQRFMSEWELEKCDPIDDSEFPLTRQGKGWRVENSHENLKKFLRQVRASRGYDVDVIPPEFACSPFFPMPLSYYKQCEKSGEKLNAQLNFVVAEINSQSEMHSKMERFEFNEVEKIVEARPNRCTLLTFSVNEIGSSSNIVKTVQAMVYNAPRYNFELKEWRFKPEEDEGEEEEDE